MISLDHVSKQYRARHGVVRTIMSDVSLDLPQRNIAVLGRNGMGKSTLLRMMAGIEEPDSGKIFRHRSVSWPIGFRGSFHRELSGLENVRFVARIFGQNTERTIDFVADFAELGLQFRAPVKTYSSGMAARLAFGLSMAINFEVYLIDELMAVGDSRFQTKCREVFGSKLSKSNIVMVSHGMDSLREFCDAGIVLHEGRVRYCDELEEAIALYQELNAAPH